MFWILQNILSQHQDDLMKCQTAPLHSISIFLSELLEKPHPLPIVKKSLSAARKSIPPEGFQVLHSCIGFTQKELISQILSIFGGIPEQFQIFRCQLSSTQEELALFLQRATKFRILHLILEVNKLPFHLQEVNL